MPAGKAPKSVPKAATVRIMGDVHQVEAAVERLARGTVTKTAESSHSRRQPPSERLLSLIAAAKSARNQPWSVCGAQFATRVL